MNLAVRVFGAAARFLLPATFHREFASEWRAAFADQYRAVRRRARPKDTIQFWLREILGLLSTAVREYRSIFLDRRQTMHRRRRTQAHTPKRNREMLNTLRKDVHYAFRTIVKTPVVTTVAVLSLALGITATTVVFSMLNSWLLRPLPYPDADRLVLIYGNNRNTPDRSQGVAPANFHDWRAQARSFSVLIASDFDLVNLTDVERPEQLTINRVSPNFFSVVGADPMLGRTFLLDEGGAASAPVAVLGETLWRNQFGAAPDIVGKTLTLNGTIHTVVGVMPETFDFILGSVDLWTAADFESRRDDRQVHSMVVTGRLRAGVTLDQAQTEMAAIASRMEELYPATNEDWGVNVQSIRDEFPGPEDRGLITVLMAVVSMVLMIACVNAASLLLAKTDARQKEMAIRVALGAGKKRLVRQLLTESVVLALMAGMLGGTLSFWLIPVLAQAIPDALPNFFQPRFDATVAGFVAAIAVVGGLAFGVTPAAQAISGNLQSALIDGSRGGTASRKRKRLRSAFVMTEFAMALAILVGAAVLTDLFHTRLGLDPGFDPENLLTMELNLPEHKYPDNAAVVAFFDEAKRQVEQLSGAEAVAFASELPRVWNLPSSTFTIDGQAVEPGEEPRAGWLSVSAGFFESLEIPLRNGRTFTDADRSDAPPVVLVNQRTVERFFGGEIPVGQRVTVQGESREIVGVVSDFVQTRMAGLEPHRPTVYFPMAQRPVRLMRMAVRTPSDPFNLAAPVQAAIANVDPDQPVSNIRTLEEFMQAQLAGPTAIARLLFAVGFLALALAAIGIYGVMAYTVSQQTNEIGIRMALGAKPRQVLASVTRQGAKLAGLGLALGIPIAALVIRGIAGIIQNAAAEIGRYCQMLWIGE